MRAWILYSGIRIGLFAVLFVVLYALTASLGVAVPWLIAGIGAAVLAFCISYIFLTPLRTRVAVQVAEARTSTGTKRAVVAGSDEDAEDSAN
jgi:hypothetical protein